MEFSFGQPPHGWEFANPERLTPAQVQVDLGYRLTCEGESGKIECEYWLPKIGKWTAQACRINLPNFNLPFTQRTKAAPPAPRQTEEEKDLWAFLEWHRTNYRDGDEDMYPRMVGWKAKTASLKKKK